MVYTPNAIPNALQNPIPGVPYVPLIKYPFQTMDFNFTLNCQKYLFANLKGVKKVHLQ